MPADTLSALGEITTECLPADEKRWFDFRKLAVQSVGIAGQVDPWAPAAGSHAVLPPASRRASRMRDFRHRLSPSLSRRDVAIVKDGTRRAGALLKAPPGCDPAVDREPAGKTARSATAALTVPRAANDS